MPKPGKGSGKSAGSVGHDDETPGSGPDRRLPREPLGPYNRPFPVDGCPWERRMWASERRKGKGKGKSTSAGLLDIMIDQLPMLTEKGLREMMVALSCELSFRGDVREENEKVQLAHEASGGKGSAFPPEELLEIVRTRGARGTPKSSILIGFSIIFTIHFGVFPYFWKHPYHTRVTTSH